MHELEKRRDRERLPRLKVQPPPSAVVAATPEIDRPVPLRPKIPYEHAATHKIRSTDWNVNFIGGSNGLIRLGIRVCNFPPPLAGGDLNSHRILGRRSMDSFAGDYTYHKNDEQRYNRDTHSQSDHPSRSMVAFFILHDGKRMTGCYPGLRAGPGKPSDHQNKNRG